MEPYLYENKGSSYSVVRNKEDYVSEIVGDGEEKDIHMEYMVGRFLEREGDQDWVVGDW